MGDAKRDANQITTLIGVSSADGITPVTIYVDPVTHRVLTSSVGAASPGGNDTEVQFNDAGTLQGDPGMTYNKTTNVLTVGGAVIGSLSGILKASTGAVATASAGTDYYAPGSTDVAITDGGTGASSASTAFNNLSPMTVLGDIIYGGASGAGTRLAGNTAATKKYLSQTGDGVNSAAPVWGVIAAADLPTSIDATKIADGSVTSAEFQYIGGLTSDAQTQLDAKVPKSLFDANTIIYATTDNTPVALTVSEQTVVGRATGGAIAAIAIDSDLSSVSANDDTVPSAKATKAYADLMLPLAGGTMSGNILLGENANLQLDTALSADGKYTGIIIASQTAGEALAFGDLVYFKAADSRWWHTDANAAATAGDVLLAICVLAAGSGGSATTVMMYGKIRADAVFPTMTISAPMYISETAGLVTGTQPTTADVVIRRVGFALTADELYFNPSNDYVTHV